MMWGRRRRQHLPAWEVHNRTDSGRKGASFDVSLTSLSRHPRCTRRGRRWRSGTRERHPHVKRYVRCSIHVAGFSMQASPCRLWQREKHPPPQAGSTAEDGNSSLSCCQPPLLPCVSPLDHVLNQGAALWGAPVPRGRWMPYRPQLAQSHSP
jgi:hypothetical protein